MQVVELLEYTPNPEKIVADAARLCYSNSTIKELMTSMTKDKIEGLIDKLASMGHESPFEHVSFTFGIEGVSRALLAQISRHRIASFSVQSQRYCEFDGFNFVIPDSIKNNSEASVIYAKTLDDTLKGYKKLISLGIPKEDARFLLTSAAETKIVITMNARSLFHFFEVRSCDRAQWEIRSLSNKMLQLAKKVAPHLFAYAGPTCVKGYCTEGVMSCGKAPTLQSLIKEYKNRLKE